jgi:hypothetical protein
LVLSPNYGRLVIVVLREDLWLLIVCPEQSSQNLRIYFRCQALPLVTLNKIEESSGHHQFFVPYLGTLTELRKTCDCDSLSWTIFTKLRIYFRCQALSLVIFNKIKRRVSSWSTFCLLPFHFHRVMEDLWLLFLSWRLDPNSLHETWGYTLDAKHFALLL